MNKNNIVIIFLLLSTLGCTPKDRRYGSIEFIAYNWTISNEGNEWTLHCSTYALIDSFGYCYLIYDPIYPKTETKYLKLRIEKKAINRLLNVAENLPTDVDLRPKIGTTLYDGPSLKIRFNNGPLTKTIHFIDDSNPKVKDLLQFYYFTVSNYSSTNIGVIDTTYLINRKVGFIEYSVKSDYILRPPPPAPSEFESIK